MSKLKSISLAILVVVICFAGSGSSYEVGDAVSEFKLKNVDGKMVALSDYLSGKGVIVIFDCNTCPYSKVYNDRIIALNQKYSESGFPVVAINANDPNISPGDSFDEMVSYAKEKNYKFPYLIDQTQEVARAFGASNTPHVYVLKKDGKSFKVAYKGAIDNNTRDASAADKKYVEDAVESLIAGKEIVTTKTKAIGCTIKWKNM
ncbi:MAG TPA: thioredoxin family protein [Ohtaekwangia sp.]